jgi:hypothetical protein
VSPKLYSHGCLTLKMVQLLIKEGVRSLIRRKDEEELSKLMRLTRKTEGDGRM